MINLMRSLLLTVCFLFFSASLNADVSGKVNSWFDGMDYANVTMPGVYEGQNARFATLGGISTRSEIKNVFHFVDVQTPKLSAGCGGIDFYAGGFSAINADAFVENLRAIGQNAQSLAFMLAIQIVSPQLSGVMNDIKSFADEFNKFNQSSCDAAALAVGGAMDLMGAKEGNCTVKRMSDYGEDWTTAENACLGGEMDATEASGGDPNKIDFVSGNLAWMVLMNDPYFQADLELAEMVMNLTGTFIISDADADPTGGVIPYTLNAAVDDSGNLSSKGKNIVTALLSGSEAEAGLTYYKCVEERTNQPTGCTKLSANQELLTMSNLGIKGKVRAEMIQIVDNIYEDKPLSDIQKGIIGTSRIPLYKFLTTVAAYYPRGFNVATVTSSYTDLIAQDIVFSNLANVLEVVNESVPNLPNGVGLSKKAVEFQASVQNVLKGVRKMEEKNINDADQYFAMQTKIKLYEKAIISRLSSGLVSSSMWSY